MKILRIALCPLFISVSYYPDCVIICIQDTSVTLSASCVKLKPAFSLRPLGALYDHVVNLNVGELEPLKHPSPIVLVYSAAETQNVKVKEAAVVRSYTAQKLLMSPYLGPLFFTETKNNFTMYYSSTQFTYYEGQDKLLIMEDGKWSLWSYSGERKIYSWITYGN